MMTMNIVNFELELITLKVDVVIVKIVNFEVKVSDMVPTIYIGMAKLFHYTCIHVVNLLHYFYTVIIVILN